MKSKILDAVKFFLGWPLSIVAFIFIVRIISPDFSKIIDSIAGMNVFFLIASIGCFLIYYFLRSFFWQKLLFYKGHSVSFKETTYLWGNSEIKRFIPGNIWGILGRSTAFSQKGINQKVIFSSLAVEAEFLVFSSLILSLLSLPFIIFGIFSFLPFKDLFLYLLPIIAFVLLFVFLGNKFLFKKTSLPFFITHIIPHVPFSQNFFLFVISLVYMFFFCLGTYFSIHALFFLSPLYVLTFLGLISFSFFIGYASFITPMGIGVREGMLAVGLSKFIPLSPAGFGAIFARIILIISEVIFLIFTLSWNKSRSIYLLKLENKIQKYWQEILLGILIFLYCLYFTAASFYRYVNFYTGRFDLGNMDQTVWNTLHGHIFQLTNPDGTNIISRLSFHADFILVLFAPFYLIWQDPRILLFLQTIILAIGAVFVFLIARKILDSRTSALIFASVYLLNPSIQYSNLYDFHAVTLATTFFLAAYYFLLKKSYPLVILFLFLSAITKEQVWVVTALFGLYMIYLALKRSRKETQAVSYKNKEIILGAVIFLISCFAFYLIFFKAIPALHGGNHFALSYYSDFGSSPAGIVKNIFLSPLKTLSVIFSLDRLQYLKLVFLPYGFLPILEPVFLIFTLPDFAINLLSSNNGFHQIYFQYTAVITPFLFLGTIFAVKKLHEIIPKVSVFSLSVFILFAAIFSAYFYGPLPGAKDPSLDMFINPQPYAQIIDDFLQGIPQKYSIAATNNLGSHLSHRQKIFTVPVGIDQADIILFLLNDKFAAPSLSAQIQMAEKMKHDKNYIEIFKAGDFVVFEKRNLYLHTEPNTDKIKLFPVSIPTLQERDFVGGDIRIVKKAETKKEFSSYVISYPSDGLTLYALMDIPNIKKPLSGFPVVIIDHGFIRPSNYDTEKSYKIVTDFFASNGFLVIKPDYRGNGNSEQDKNISYLLSYPIDVLNLLSSLPNIKDANKSEVFLWGHSVGSAVTLTVLETGNQYPDFPVTIKGAAVWSSVTDPYKAYQQFVSLFPKNNVPYENAVKILGPLNRNSLLWQSVSPLFYLDDITTPIQIMQGTNDSIIPYSWSIELYNDLKSLNKSASLKIYPNDDHVLTKFRYDALNRNLQFFQRLMKR